MSSDWGCEHKLSLVQCEKTHLMSRKQLLFGCYFEKTVTGDLRNFSIGSLRCMYRDAFGMTVYIFSAGIWADNHFNCSQ